MSTAVAGNISNPAAQLHHNYRLNRWWSDPGRSVVPNSTRDDCFEAEAEIRRAWSAGVSDAIVRCVSQMERITSDPAICHGQPTVRGLRYTVQSLLELLSAGMTIDEILGDYPDLEREDILAALEFGARAAGRSRVVPLAAG
jgi:uncharacterized protein (DUF433 family)